MNQQGLFGDPPAQDSRPRSSDTKEAQALHTWFFALRPSAEDALRIHAFGGKLLSEMGVSGRLTDPERLHVTLEWLGPDVDDAAIEAACRAADTLRFSRSEARFDAALTFSAPKGPFVLLGGEGLDDVRRLRNGLVMAMADRGFKPSRAYEPHMTLCYDQRHRVARTSIEPIGITVTEFALVKSHVGLSRHEVLRTWQLNG